jgi:hypothetical protein
LVAGHALVIGWVEPFRSAAYTFLWWPFILAADACVYRLRGQSMLHDRPREFLLLTLWSTPVWLIFEALNLHLNNWWYVAAPATNLEGLLLAPAYATVLPGIFELTELAEGILLRLTGGRGVRGPGFVVRPAHLWIQWSVGVAMLALTMAWPEQCFCLVWGFAFLLLDPLCHRLGGRSLLGQFARGNQTRFAALLLAGFISGGLWESWNMLARAKWVYTVPGFESFKLGEMPLLGFLGFPPFVLECYAIVNTIGLLRRGRSWELSAEENARLRGMPRWRTLWTWCVTVGLSLVVLGGVFDLTTVTFSAPLRQDLRKVLTDRELRTLAAAGIRFADELNRVATGADRRPARREALDALSPEHRLRAESLCAVASVNGLELRLALVLESLGVRTVEDLARCVPERLADEIGHALGRRRPSAALVATWVYRARERTAQRR